MVVSLQSEGARRCPPRPVDSPEESGRSTGPNGLVLPILSNLKHGLRFGLAQPDADMLQAAATVSTS
jgi:hypothetical protein